MVWDGMFQLRMRLIRSRLMVTGLDFFQYPAAPVVEGGGRHEQDAVRSTAKFLCKELFEGERGYGRIAAFPFDNCLANFFPGKARWFSTMTIGGEVEKRQKFDIRPYVHFFWFFFFSNGRIDLEEFEDQGDGSIWQETRVIMIGKFAFEIAYQSVGIHSSPYHEDRDGHDGQSECDQCRFLSEPGLKKLVNPVDGVCKDGNEDH